VGSQDPRAAEASAGSAPSGAKSSRLATARIVQLGQEHATAFQLFLLDLDDTSRAGFFARPVNDDDLLHHAAQARSTAAWMGGALVEGQLRGVIALHDAETGGSISAALAVDSGWRDRGLGSALLGAALGWARASGRRELRMGFSRLNWPMRRLAAKAGARLDLVLGEVVAAVAVGDRSAGAAPFQHSDIDKAAQEAWRGDCSFSA